jgi:hypothetical protein
MVLFLLMHYNEGYTFDIGIGSWRDQGCGRAQEGRVGQLWTSQREDGRPGLAGLPSSLWEQLRAGVVDAKRRLWRGDKNTAAHHRQATRDD